MHKSKARLTLALSGLAMATMGARSMAAQSTRVPTGHVSIAKPQSRTLQGGSCRILEQHARGGVWGTVTVSADGHSASFTSNDGAPRVIGVERRRRGRSCCANAARRKTPSKIVELETPVENRSKRR